MKSHKGNYSFRKEIPLLIFLVSFLIEILSVAASGQVNQMYQDAISQVKEKQYGKSIKSYYKFILKCDPLSSVESRRNDLAPAIEYFETAGKREIPAPSYSLLKSVLERILLELPQANTGLERLKKLHPDSSFLEFLKGEFLLASGKTEEAVLSFEKLRKMPRSEGLNGIVHGILERQGINADAVAKRAGLLRQAFRRIDLLERGPGEKLLRQVLQEYPGDAEASRALIDLLIEMNRLNDAQKVLDELMAISPASILPSQEARLRFYQGKFQEVPEVLASVEDNLDEFSLFVLGESYFQLGKFAESLPLFRKLIDTDQLNTGFLLRETACLEGLGYFASAAEILTMESNRQSDSLILRMELGGLLERMNRQRDAIHEYRKVADISGPLQADAKERIELLEKWLAEKQQIETSIQSPSVKSRQPVKELLSAPEKSISKPSFERLISEQTETEKRLKRLYE